MAERALREFREQSERDASGEARQPTNLTVASVAELHIAQLGAGEGDVKPNTIRDYRSYLRVHLAPFFAEVKIEDVSIADVERFIVVQREKGLASSTVSNHVNFLHGVFAYAMRHEIIQRNPVALARKPRVRSARRDFAFLTIEEVEMVIGAYPVDHLTRTDRTIVVSAAMTGLRQGELIALRWSDIDLDGAQVFVRASISRGITGTPKSSTSVRVVPLAQRVIRVLREHRAHSLYAVDSDLVFCHPHTGNPYDPSKMRDRFYEAMRTAGLGRKVGLNGGGITFHSLRHTFGTQMASAGAPLVAIKEWMGHADIQTTMIYAKWAKDRKAESELLARAFSA
ncbi:MAG: site-specific integrase [Solirubrobacterales bacterium]|nr:site-specific integrase [Solirubrobacterales bacterium]